MTDKSLAQKREILEKFGSSTYDEQREQLAAISEAVDQLLIDMTPSLSDAHRWARDEIAKVAFYIGVADTWLNRADIQDQAENTADLAYEQARESGL